jgi:predicted dehydrogenase
MIKWGMIGCGDVTELKSGPAFNKVADSELVAIMRRDAAKAEDYAKRHGVKKWYSNADDLINDPEVNAIYVATPPNTHAEYAIKAMRAGKPVYIEKPMALNYAECQEILKVSQETGVKCFVAYYRRYMPYFQKVKKLVEIGAIGEVQLVNVRFVCPPKKEDYCRNTLTWRVKPDIAGAGYFYDLASHQLDLLNYLFGDITEATGFPANFAGYYDAEDTVTGIFKFERGIVGTGSWCFVSDVNQSVDKIELIGSQGRISFSCFSFKPIKLITEAFPQPQFFLPENPENVQFYLIEAVVKDLKGKEHCESDGVSGAKANWVMDKILGKI